MHTHLQHLVVKCSNNMGGMKEQPVKLKVDDEPIFLKRRVIPYGQRDGVLQTPEKMERDGIITRVTSSTWATPIVIAIKSDGKTPRILLIDSYFKWPEVFLTSAPTTSFVMRVLRKCFGREGVPQVLVTDNGSEFCAAELKTWLGSFGCRHLRTAPRHPCSNGAAENLVKTVKSAIASANPRTIFELEILLENFLLQYRNAEHATTKESPAKLFKARSLRSSLRCVDSSDVIYFRRNDLRPSRRIITRKIGQNMVEITDLKDATVHRRHIDQNHINETPTLNQDRAK
ncbi:unnamed protein product [Echinostoma caproni]|uniref:Integrase catalytic domain-containing protein n=1 Tax=Echinostoma caproni TaxID=27848 RepID=A0A183B378_9TREM|nr:unnamed protein product [Echinostoma caproni]